MNDPKDAAEVVLEIFNGIVVNSLPDEEILELERLEKEKLHKLRVKQAWDYIYRYCGERIASVFKDKENWKETKAISTLRQLKNGKCGFIHSKAGAGKTVAGVWFIARKKIDGLDVVYVNSSNLIRDMSFTDILVIDDIGTEDLTNKWLSIFWDVINYRYQHKKTTVLLTNLVLNDWLLRYDGLDSSRKEEGRIYTRVWQWTHEHGGVFAEWCGENLRMKGEQ